MAFYSNKTENSQKSLLCICILVLFWTSYLDLTFYFFYFICCLAKKMRTGILKLRSIMITYPDKYYGSMCSFNCILFFPLAIMLEIFKLLKRDCSPNLNSANILLSFMLSETWVTFFLLWNKKGDVWQNDSLKLFLNSPFCAL